MNSNDLPHTYLNDILINTIAAPNIVENLGDKDCDAADGKHPSQPASFITQSKADEKSPMQVCC